MDRQVMFILRPQDTAHPHPLVMEHLWASEGLKGSRSKTAELSMKVPGLRRLIISLK